MAVDYDMANNLRKIYIFIILIAILFIFDTKVLLLKKISLKLCENHDGALNHHAAEVFLKLKIMVHVHFDGEHRKYAQLKHHVE
jgi:hypothetical protein